MEYKMRILAIVDNKNWCWTKTTEDIAYHVGGFEIDLLQAVEYKRMKIKPQSYDLIWGRGYCWTFIQPHDEPLNTPFIWTLTTGGAALKERFDQCEKIGKQAVGIIVQNKTAYTEAARRGYRNIWLIPNGINTRLFFPAQSRRRKLKAGFAGNNYGSRSELKGIPFIIKACEEIEMEYREANNELPLSHEAMPQFYNSIDIYVQPSESEGCSNSVMEAMACGLPCLICEDIGYHGEVCKDGILHDDGEVVFVERNARDIANKLKTLVENPYIYSRISRNARRFAEEHDWKYMARSYKKCFEDVATYIKYRKPVAADKKILDEIRLPRIEIEPAMKYEDMQNKNKYVEVLCGALFYKGKKYYQGHVFEIEPSDMKKYEGQLVEV